MCGELIRGSCIEGECCGDPLGELLRERTNEDAAPPRRDDCKGEVRGRGTADPAAFSEIIVLAGGVICLDETTLYLFGGFSVYLFGRGQLRSPVPTSVFYLAKNNPIPCPSDPSIFNLALYYPIPCPSYPSIFNLALYYPIPCPSDLSWLYVRMPPALRKVSVGKRGAFRPWVSWRLDMYPSDPSIFYLALYYLPIRSPMAVRTHATGAAQSICGRKGRVQTVGIMVARHVLHVECMLSQGNRSGQGCHAPVAHRCTASQLIEFLRTSPLAKIQNFSQNFTRLTAHSCGLGTYPRCALRRAPLPS